MTGQWGCFGSGIMSQQQLDLAQGELRFRERGGERCGGERDAGGSAGQSEDRPRWKWRRRI